MKDCIYSCGKSRTKRYCWGRRVQQVVSGTETHLCGCQNVLGRRGGKTHRLRSSVCKKKQTGEPRTTSLFPAYLQVESQVRICGREPVRFVRNFWKRNTPRRQYTARAADGSGRDNAGHLSGNLKFRGRSLINELDPYWQLQCLMLLAPPGEFSNVAGFPTREGFRTLAILLASKSERRILWLSVD